MMNLRLHVFAGQFLWLLATLNCKRAQGIPGYGRNLLIKALPPIEDYQSGIYEVFMEPYLYDFGHHQSYPPSAIRAEKQIDMILAGSVWRPLPYGSRSILRPGFTEFISGSLICHDLVSLNLLMVAWYAKPGFTDFIITNLPGNPGVRPPSLQAIVHLQPDEESGVIGDLVFTQVAPNGPVTIQGNITGLTSGLHGIHVHQAGAVKENCKEIGPHFLAYYGRHGGPRDSVRHVGDLGNIKAEEGVTVEVKIVDHLISLAGPRSIVGRSLGISKGEDDYGRAGTEESGLTGTSGPTIACGIIGYLH